MNLCLQAQTRGSSCQGAPVAQVPAEHRAQGLCPCFGENGTPPALAPQPEWIHSSDIQGPLRLCSQIFLSAGTPGWRVLSKRVRNSPWKLLLGAGAAPWVQLHGHSKGLQLSQNTEPCPKSSLLLRNSFFKLVLALVFHSCPFYITSRSTSVFSLLQATFQVFVKSCWRFTNNLPGFGLAGGKGFVKRVGSYFSPGAAEILKVKCGQQEHLCFLSLHIWILSPRDLWNSLENWDKVLYLCFPLACGNWNFILTLLFIHLHK